MNRIFQKITPLEWVVLGLTLAFVLGTVGWYAATQPEEGVTLVTLTETDRELLPPEQPGAPGMLEGEVLDLNTASHSDLTRLPGIGDTKAAAIVRWREDYGPFRAVEDLLAVDGIGEKTLETLRPYVTAGASNTEGGS